MSNNSAIANAISSHENVNVSVNFVEDEDTLYVSLSTNEHHSRDIVVDDRLVNDIEPYDGQPFSTLPLDLAIAIAEDFEDLLDAVLVFHADKHSAMLTEDQAHRVIRRMAAKFSIPIQTWSREDFESYADDALEDYSPVDRLKAAELAWESGDDLGLTDCQDWQRDIIGDALTDAAKTLGLSEVEEA